MVIQKIKQYIVMGGIVYVLTRPRVVSVLTNDLTLPIIFGVIGLILSAGLFITYKELKKNKH